MLGISFSGGAHWIVIVGYVIDDKTNTVIALLTLDPGYKSQSVAFWNGYISLKIENNNKRKTYKYFYAPMNRLISIDEIFLFTLTDTNINYFNQYSPFKMDKSPDIEKGQY